MLVFYGPYPILIGFPLGLLAVCCKPFYRIELAGGFDLFVRALKFGGFDFAGLGASNNLMAVHSKKQGH